MLRQPLYHREAVHSALLRLLMPCQMDGRMGGWMDGPSRAAKFEAIIMTTSPNGSIR